jgi:inositol phosphorylceramide mannosyltransferase catalytic subunit
MRIGVSQPANRKDPGKQVMSDTSFQRFRRVLTALVEPSGWRSLWLATFGSQEAEGNHAALPCSEVEKVVPSGQARFDRIPPLVFQTWKSRSDIPSNYRYWRQTFVDQNPGTLVALWDDADNRDFIHGNFAWFLPIYDAYPKEIFRADAVRYFFLFLYGGLYADMDSECLRPLKLELRKDAVILARMGSDRSFDHSIPNALMASRPGQAFWLLAIQRMCEMAAAMPDSHDQAAAGPEALTGPILLKRTYDEYTGLDPAALAQRIAPVLERLTQSQRDSVQSGAVTLLDRNAWYPLDWTNPFHKHLRNHLDSKARLLLPETVRWVFPRSELVTYWSHSW